MHDAKCEDCCLASRRPTAAEVVRRLRELAATGAIARMDGSGEAEEEVSSRSCCCIQ